MSSVAFPNLQWGRIVAIGEKKFGEQGGGMYLELFFPKKKGGWSKLARSERRGKEKKRRRKKMKRKKRRRMERRRLTLPVWERKGGGERLSGAQLFWSWFGSTRVETPDVFNYVHVYNLEFGLIVYLLYIENIYLLYLIDFIFLFCFLCFK